MPNQPKHHQQNTQKNQKHRQKTKNGSLKNQTVHCDILPSYRPLPSTTTRFFFFCHVVCSTVRTGTVLITMLVLNSGYSQVELEYFTFLQIKNIVRSTRHQKAQFSWKTVSQGNIWVKYFLSWICVIIHLIFLRNCRYKMSMYTKRDNWW